MRRSCPWRWLVVAALLACLPSFATASKVWVDAINGADGNDGTRLCPLASLQKGVSLADGVDIHTVHVQPGEYREEVRVDKSHVHLVVDEEDRGKAILYASASSRNMTWRKTDLVNLPEAAHGHVWEANVSGWDSADPKLAFLVCHDGSSEGLPLAREPDWEVTTRWKHHEHWWTVDADAEHGMSSTQLAPLADLTGGRVWIKDGHTGHDTYGPTITQHVGANIRLSFVDDKDRVRTKGHTKFYVEGKVQLLDAESEWCFDAAAGKIYMWPPNDTCPEKLHMEFAKRLNAIVLLGSSSGGETNLDDIVVDGLTIRGANHEDEFYTGPAGLIFAVHF